MGRSGPERAVESRVVTRADKAGGIAIKLDPSVYAGIPDRLVILPGGIVKFVETKAPNGRPSKLQKHWHMLLHLIGFTVAVPASVEAVDALFEELLA